MPSHRHHVGLSGVRLGAVGEGQHRYRKSEFTWSPIMGYQGGDLPRRSQPRHGRKWGPPCGCRRSEDPV